MSETFDASGLRITSLTVADLAKILSAAFGRRVDEEHVRQIAEAGNLLRPDDTMNMLEYVAFLASEVEHG